MDKVQKKGKKRLLVPLFAMISVVVFLWEGCRQGNHKEHPLSSQITNGELIEAQADSLKERLLEKFL